MVTQKLPKPPPPQPKCPPGHLPVLENHACGHPAEGWVHNPLRTGDETTPSEREQMERLIRSRNCPTCGPSPQDSLATSMWREQSFPAESATGQQCSLCARPVYPGHAAVCRLAQIPVLCPRCYEHERRKPVPVWEDSELNDARRAA